LALIASACAQHLKSPSWPHDHSARSIRPLPHAHRVSSSGFGERNFSSSLYLVRVLRCATSTRAKPKKNRSIATFCGKSPARVRKLNRRPDRIFCDDFVETVQGFIREEKSSFVKSREWHSDSQGIRKFLDDYVIGQDPPRRCSRSRSIITTIVPPTTKTKHDDVELAKSNILLIGFRRLRARRFFMAPTLAPHPPRCALHHAVRQRSPKPLCRRTSKNSSSSAAAIRRLQCRARPTRYRHIDEIGQDHAASPTTRRAPPASRRGRQQRCSYHGMQPSRLCRRRCLTSFRSATTGNSLQV